MLSTVLRNLISNAIKFSGNKGKIKISAKKSCEEIIVSVSDNGVGIVPERLEKLFRLDESESTQGTNNEKGTGLGLILCKEFVEKHGGKIWAQSKPGKGTTFYFTLFCNYNYKNTGMS
jgi:two-component system sensor histidine kinase/response regulator